jgi:hypothetical protein
MITPQQALPPQDQREIFYDDAVTDAPDHEW